jgi:hypothetical protein
MLDGEKMESYKKEYFKLKCFSPLKILTSPFYLKRLVDLSFFSFFSILFLPLFLFFFYAPPLEDLGVLMILEEKNHLFNNFFSNEMV